MKIIKFFLTITILFLFQQEELFTDILDFDSITSSSVKVKSSISENQDKTIDNNLIDKNNFESKDVSYIKKDLSIDSITKASAKESSKENIKEDEQIVINTKTDITDIDSITSASEKIKFKSSEKSNEITTQNDKADIKNMDSITNASEKIDTIENQILKEKEITKLDVEAITKATKIENEKIIQEDIPKIEIEEKEDYSKIQEKTIKINDDNDNDFALIKRETDNIPKQQDDTKISFKEKTIKISDDYEDFEVKVKDDKEAIYPKEQKESKTVTKKIEKVSNDMDSDLISTIKEEIKEKIVDPIELTLTKYNDKLEFDNSKRKSEFIIFDTENSIPLDIQYEYSQKEEEVTISIYQEKDFLPKNEKDFDNALQKYYYDTKNVIQSGYLIISQSLGELSLSKAISYFKKNELKNSKLIFEKLIHYNYRLSECYYYLSMIYYLEKNLKLSIDYMEEAISFSKDNGDNISKFYYHIGSVHYMLTNYNSAIKYLDIALTKSNTSYYIYNSIGLCYIQVGDFKKALETFKIGANYGDTDCQKNYNWLSNKMKF